MLAVLVLLVALEKVHLLEDLSVLIVLLDLQVLYYHPFVPLVLPIHNLLLVEIVFTVMQDLSLLLDQDHAPCKVLSFLFSFFLLLLLIFFNFLIFKIDN